MDKEEIGESEEFLEAVPSIDEKGQAAEPKRKRGRPPGSKNKAPGEVSVKAPRAPAPKKTVTFSPFRVLPPEALSGVARLPAYAASAGLSLATGGSVILRRYYHPQALGECDKAFAAWVGLSEFECTPFQAYLYTNVGIVAGGLLTVLFTYAHDVEKVALAPPAPKKETVQNGAAPGESTKPVVSEQPASSAAASA